MRMCCLAYVYVQGPCGGHKRASGPPGAGVIVGYKLPDIGTMNKHRSSQKQQVTLTSEKSLQLY